MCIRDRINTTRASGLCCFIRRAVSVIGVSAIEIHFACSGKSFLAMTDPVSYTHLDQPINRAESSLIIFVAVIVVTWAVREAPVSYTHLDVYKRQVEK